MLYFWATVVSVVLGVVLLRAPWTAVKPSIQFIVAANLLLQWPMAIVAPRVFAGVHAPDWVGMAVAVPLLAGLAWIPFVSGPECHAILERAQMGARQSSRSGSVRVTLVALWTVALIVVGWYLSNVPVEQTGLYVIITNPVASALAREDSLKLLDNRLLAYAYLTLASVISPAIAALSLRLSVAAARERRMLLSLVAAFSLLAAIVVASLSGARSIPARILLVAMLALWFEGGMRVRPVRLAAIPAALGLLLALMTVMREGRAVDQQTLLRYIGAGIRDRALIVPAEVGGKYVLYAEEHGPMGVAAVPRLASIVGVSPIDAANVVGRQYYPSTISSVSANATFLLSYLGYFGGIGVLLNVVFVSLLEGTMAVLRRTGETLLGPTMAMFCVANVGFLSGDFTTVLLSGGVIVIGALAILGTRWLGETPGNAPPLTPTTGTSE